MNVEVKVPEVGESVREVMLGQWYKRDGDLVKTDEILFVIETDKVTLEVTASASGILRIMVPEGTTVTAGTVVAMIDTEGAPSGREEKPARKREPGEVPEKASEEVRSQEYEPTGVRASSRAAEAERQQIPSKEAEPRQAIMPPSVRRFVTEKNIDVSKVTGTGPGGRITKGDVLTYLEKTSARPVAGRIEETGHAEVGEVRETPRSSDDQNEATTRKPMSPIRKMIAERLLQAKQSTVMLTTFNEIDMGHVQAVRAQLKESFKAEYGVSLGLMSFFIKATVEALKEYPEVNASIDGHEIVYHHYHHIGVAVGAERGLVVPVIRHADRLSFAEIESAIVDYVKKIKENHLELSDLEGGTFTISNGGIYGSLLSTPILNMPQSGILGMHKIEDRPVAVNAQVVVRPMMYVALSYDHRIIDGREAVSFLKRIKEIVENPERIMLEI
jgi:2-oxoglutarate dehydrogenase E2 component (dihydrolipoamide succinyltransferase)